MIDKRKAIAFPILCIPIIAAVIVGTGVFNDKDTKPSNSVLESVVITSEDGESFQYADKDILDLYSKIISNATPVASPELVENAPTFTVRFDGTVEQNEYYFTMASDDPANCVYKNLNGEYFSIARDDAYNLLLRNEFASAYDVDGISNLIFTYGDTVQRVSASKYNWSYKRVDGEYAPNASNSTEAALSRVVIPNSASFDMSFDKKPDSVIITAMDGTNQVYKGEFGGLPTALNYTSDKLLNLTVEAKWYKNDSSDSFGDAVYSFELFYDVPATYKLVDKRLKQGEFTVIRVTNGGYNDTVTASSDLMDGDTKIFTSNGKQYIFVPISLKATPGKHNIVVNDPAGPVNLSFEVVKVDFKEQNGVYSSEVIGLNTTDAKNKYLEIISGLTSSDRILWSGKFIAPVAGTVEAAFGTNIKITGVEEPTVAKGTYYKAANGTSVKSANDGVIVYAGSSDYMGNAVIIDHGAGVMSYYLNLGTVTAKTGDSVKKGTTIGTVGTSGVTPFTNTLLYANSVDGYFVNPATQIKYGINF